MTTLVDEVQEVQRLHDAGQHGAAIARASQAMADLEQRAAECPRLWLGNSAYWKLLYWRARCRAAAGDHVGALADLDEIDENGVTARSLDGDHAPQTIVRARILIEAGERDRAFEVCRSTIIEDQRSLDGMKAANLILQSGLFEQTDPAGLALAEVARRVPRPVDEGGCELWALECLFRAYFLLEEGEFEESIRSMHLVYYDLTFMSGDLEELYQGPIDALGRKWALNTDGPPDSTWTWYPEMFSDPQVHFFCAVISDAELGVQLHPRRREGEMTESLRPGREERKETASSVSPALLWPRAADTAGSNTNPVPEVERCGPDYLSELATDLMANGGWLLSREADHPPQAAPSPPSDSRLRSIFRAYVTGSHDTERRLARASLMAIHREMRSRLAQRFPEEGYTNEWLIRDLMVFEAMAAGGLDADWIEENNHRHLQASAMEIIASMLWRPGVTGEVYMQVSQAIPFLEHIETAMPGIGAYWRQSLPLTSVLSDMEDAPEPPSKIATPWGVLRAVQETGGFTPREVIHLGEMPAEEVEWVFQQAIERQTGPRGFDTPAEEARWVSRERVQRILENSRSLVQLLTLTAGVRHSVRRTVKRLYGTAKALDDRSWGAHRSLIEAFCEMSKLTAAKRGRTLAQLERELRALLRWADSYRPFWSSDDPIPALTWDQFLEISNAWDNRHRIGEDDRPAEWNTALGSQSVDGRGRPYRTYTATPLCDADALRHETTFMLQDFRNTDHLERCREGSARIFRISQDRWPGDRELLLGLILIVRTPAGGWQVEEEISVSSDYAHEEELHVVGQAVAERYGAAAQRRG